MKILNKLKTNPLETIGIGASCLLGAIFGISMALWSIKAIESHTHLMSMLK